MSKLDCLQETKPAKPDVPVALVFYGANKELLRHRLRSSISCTLKLTFKIYTPFRHDKRISIGDIIYKKMIL